MNKSFILTTALIAALFGALVLAGCDNSTGGDTGSGDNDNNTDGIASVTKLKIQNETSFILDDVTWGSAVVSSRLAVAQSRTVNVTEGVGYLYFTKGGADGLKCRTQEAIAVSKDETKELVLTNNTIVVAVEDTDNVQALGTIAARLTYGTIKNDSSYSLQDVVWKGAGFAETTAGSTIGAGTSSIKKDVIPGSDYVFFIRTTDSLYLRTKNAFSCERYDDCVFTINDTTEVVEVGYETNTETLQNISGKMVFFDDAEGDYKAYTQRKSFSYSSVAKHGGKKGIFAYVYYLIPSVLEFSCNLAAPAKLAFWYKANGFYPSDKMLLYINGSLTTTWTTQSDWVYAEYSLTAGNTVIQFSFDEANSIHSIDTNVYFALDDLMVVYE